MSAGVVFARLLFGFALFPLCFRWRAPGQTVHIGAQGGTVPEYRDLSGGIGGCSAGWTER